MMNKEKVSIIVPAYNASGTIKRCIRSITGGIYTNIEIIIIEDASPDGGKCYKICQELAGEDDRIFLYKNIENKGVSYTRNRGLENATGKYIMFVDSDDYVEKNFVAQAVDVISKGEGAFAIMGYLNHDEVHAAKAEIFLYSNDEDESSFSITEEIINLYEGRLLQMLWNKIFLRDIINEHNIRFDESLKIGEDLRFILMYLEKYLIDNSDSARAVNAVTYHYLRDSDDSLMFNYTADEYSSSLDNARLLYKIAKLSEDEINRKLEEDTKKQAVMCAYFIMHNPHLNAAQKKSQIFSLPDGNKLYKEQKSMSRKEKIAKLIHR